MNTPVVSVVMPTLNHAPYVREAFSALRAQTLTDWELLIVDDGSTDATLDLCRGIQHDLPEQVQVIELRSGRGLLSTTTNAARAIMRGKYLSWLDPADRFEPRKLERLLQAVEGHPEVGLVHSAFRLIGPDGSLQGITIPDSHRGADTLFHLLEGSSINPSTALVRRSILEEAGPMTETDLAMPDLARVGDYLLWLEVAMRSEIAVVTEPLHHYRIRSGEAQATYSSALLKVAKRHFLKKHGLPTVVSAISRRSRTTRGQVYRRLASILLSENYFEDYAIFAQGLSRETAAEVGAFREYVESIQKQRNGPLVLNFYLNQDVPVPRVVLESVTGPEPLLESLAQKLLQRAKALFRQGAINASITEIESLLMISRFYPEIDSTARYYQALCHEQAGNTDAARNSYAQVLQKEGEPEVEPWMVVYPSDRAELPA